MSDRQARGLAAPAALAAVLGHVVVLEGLIDDIVRPWQSQRPAGRRTE
jgi:hypothetical protein